MPNVQSISFSKTGADADLQAQQMQIQRQQMLAEALRKQGAEPLQQQMVSGRVVPISGFEAVAKVLQSGLGAYAQKKGDDQQQELAMAKAKRSAEMLRSLFAPAGAAAPADTPLSSTPQQSTPGMQAPGQAALNPEQQRAMSAYQVDPELGRALMTNMFNQTNEQKNNAAEGLDPKLVGALRLGKMRADGMTTLQPGATTLDLSNGTERFSPKMGEGIMPAPGGGAQAVPGYGQAAAGIAGQSAQATAAAQAGYQMKEITGPDGVPRMVTAQQAAQMAGGGQPPAAQGMPPAGPQNQGFPAGAQVPAPTAGPSRLDILAQERQQIMARPDTDPRKAGDLAAITREINGAGGAAQQPAMPGIPMQSEAQRAQQVGQVENQLALDKSLRLNAQSPEAQQKVTDANSLPSLLDEAEKLIPSATGSFVGNMRDKALSVIGQDTDASKAAARMAVIAGQLTSKVPKFPGPVSDYEQKMYKEMAGNLGDPNVTPGNKMAALQTIRKLNNDIIARSQGSMPAAAARAVQGGGGLSPAEAAELAQLRAQLGRK